jgi:hypothetical protein
MEFVCLLCYFNSHLFPAMKEVVFPLRKEERRRLNFIQINFILYITQAMWECTIHSNAYIIGVLCDETGFWTRLPLLAQVRQALLSAVLLWGSFLHLLRKMQAIYIQNKLRFVPMTILDIVHWRWIMSTIVIVILIYHSHKPRESINLLGS